MEDLAEREPRLEWKRMVDKMYVVSEPGDRRVEEPD